jgi:hypothetical protein
VLTGNPYNAISSQLNLRTEYLAITPSFHTHIAILGHDTHASNSTQ